MGFSKFDFDFIYHNGNKRQATEALSLLKTNRTDQTNIDDDIPVLYIFISSTHKNQDVNICFMRSNDVNEERGVRFSAEYAIVISMESPNDQQQFTAKTLFPSGRTNRIANKLHLL